MSGRGPIALKGPVAQFMRSHGMGASRLTGRNTVIKPGSWYGTNALSAFAAAMGQDDFQPPSLQGLSLTHLSDPNSSLHRLGHQKLAPDLTHLLLSPDRVQSALLEEGAGLGNRSITPTRQNITQSMSASTTTTANHQQRISFHTALAMIRKRLETTYADRPLLTDLENDTAIIKSALFNLMTSRFNPAKVDAGKPPSVQIIAASIRFGYHFVHGEAASDSHKVEQLTGILSRYLNDYAESLSLVGTGKSTETLTIRSSAKRLIPEPIPTADRVIVMHATLDELQRLCAEQNSNPELHQRLQAELTSAKEHLEPIEDRLTRRRNDLISRLAEIDYRQRVITALDLIDTHVENFRVIYAEATTQLDAKKAAYFLNYVSHDIDIHLEAYNQTFGFNPDLLRKFMSLYIGFWEYEQEGRAVSHINHSPAAEQNALLIVRREIPDPLVQNEFTGAARIMLHQILRLESQRYRPSIQYSRSLDTLSAPPRTYNLRNRTELRAVMGDRIVDHLQTHLELIRSGSEYNNLNTRDRLSLLVRFHELFLHYIHFGLNIYGANFNETRILEQGLEPHIVKTLLFNVRARSRYNEPVLLELCKFMESLTSKPSPELALLKPRTVASTYTEPLQQTAEGKFVRYTGGGFQGLLDNMPFPITPEMKARFESELQISFRRPLSYGSPRKQQTMTLPIWNALVSIAHEKGELRAFLKMHRPAQKDKAEWEQHIDTSDIPALLNLANQNIPHKISSEDWDTYVQLQIDEGHTEEITQGPGDQESYDKLAMIYEYFNRELEKYGMALDIWDFLASINPIAAELVEKAEAEGNGVIRIMLQKDLEGLKPSQWTLEGFAAIVRSQRYTTENMDQTIYQHAKGNVAKPEYRTLRRYTDPLGATSRGGPEHAHKLYQFMWLMFPYVLHLVRNYSVIYGIAGNLLSQPSAKRPSRFALQMDQDFAHYGIRRTALLPQKESSIIIDIRRGHYDRELHAARSFMENLQSLPCTKRLNLSDFTPITPQELMDRIAELETELALYKTGRESVDSMEAAYQKDSLANLRLFNRRVQTLSRNIFHLMQVQVKIETGAGNISAYVTPMASSKTSDTNSGELPVIQIDDLFADNNNLSPEQRNAIFFLRILAGTEDCSEEIIAAVTPHWKTEWLALENAVALYLRLKARPATTQARSLSRLPVTHGFTHSRATSATQSRTTQRSLKTWETKFHVFAQEKSLNQKNQIYILESLRTYFKHVRSAYTTFKPNTLRSAIESFLLQADQELLEPICELIGEFFERIGIPNKAKPIRDELEIAAGNATEFVANRAVEEYIEYLPTHRGETGPILVLEPLLWEFVWQLASEHLELHPDSHLAFRMARSQLDDYNRRRGPKLKETSRALIPLAATGLFPERLEELLGKCALPESLTKSTQSTLRLTRFVSAFKVLQLALPYNKSATEDRITMTLDHLFLRLKKCKDDDSYKSKPEEIALLKAMLLEQKRALQTLDTLISDPFLGIEQFVRQYYSGRLESNRQFLAEDRYEAMTRAYLEARLTSSEAIDVRALVRDYIEDAFAPYDELVEAMTDFHIELMQRYFLHVEKQLAQQSEEIELFKLAIGEIAELENPTTTNTQELLVEAEKQEATTLSLSELLDLEYRLHIIRQVLGIASTETGITEYADSTFRKQIQPKLAIIDRTREECQLEFDRLSGETDTILSGVRREIPQTARAYSSDTQALETAISEQRRVQGLLTKCQELQTQLSIASHNIDLLNTNIDFLDATSGEDINYNQRVAELQSDMTVVEDQLEERIEELQAQKARLQERIQELTRIDRLREFAAEAERLVSRIHQRLETTTTRIEAMPTIDPTLDQRLVVAIKRAREISEQEQVTTNEFKELMALQLYVEVDETFETARKKLPPFISQAEEHLEQSQILLADIQEFYSNAQFPATNELTAATTALQAQIESLQTSIKQYEATLQTLRDTRDDISDALTSAEGKLKHESSFEIPDGSIIPHHRFIETAETATLFKNVPASRGAKGKASHTLAHWLNPSVLVSVDPIAPVTLINRRDSTTIQQWQRTGRKGNLEIHDMFGRPIRFIAGQMGIRVQNPNELFGNHPFKKLVSLLKGYASARDAEFEVMIELSAKAINGDTDAIRLLGSLIATINREGAIRQKPETALIVGRWTLANRDELRRLFPELIQRCVTVSPTKPQISIDIPDSYSPEVHRAQALIYETVLSDPNFFLLFLPSRGMVITTLESINSCKDTGSLKIFDPNTRTYSDAAISTEESAKISAPGTKKELEHQVYRTLRLIHHTPELRALGYLYNKVLTAQYPAPKLITNMLIAYSNMLAAHSLTPPHQTPYFSLMRIQEMVIEYEQSLRSTVADEDLMAIDLKTILQTVREVHQHGTQYINELREQTEASEIRMILATTGLRHTKYKEWVASQVSLKKILAAMQQKALADPSYRKELAKFYVLFSLKEEELGLYRSYAIGMLDFLVTQALGTQPTNPILDASNIHAQREHLTQKYFKALATLTRNPLQYQAIYGKPPDILLSILSGINTSQNMKIPEASYVHPDSSQALVTTLFSMIKKGGGEVSEAATRQLRTMYRIPESIPLLTLFGIDSIPNNVFLQVHRIILKYDSGTMTDEACFAALAKLYIQNIDEIRHALGEETSLGISHAKAITGLEQPWLRITPEQRVYFAMRELTMFNQEFLHRYMLSTLSNMHAQGDEAATELVKKCFEYASKLPSPILRNAIPAATALLSKANMVDGLYQLFSDPKDMQDSQFLERVLGYILDPERVIAMRHVLNSNDAISGTENLAEELLGIQTAGVENRLDPADIERLNQMTAKRYLARVKSLGFFQNGAIPDRYLVHWIEHIMIRIASVLNNGRKKGTGLKYPDELQMLVLLLEICDSTGVFFNKFLERTATRINERTRNTQKINIAMQEAYRIIVENRGHFLSMQWARIYILEFYKRMQKAWPGNNTSLDAIETCVEEMYIIAIAAYGEDKMQEIHRIATTRYIQSSDESLRQKIELGKQMSLLIKIKMLAEALGETRLSEQKFTRGTTSEEVIRNAFQDLRKQMDQIISAKGSATF